MGQDRQTKRFAHLVGGVIVGSKDQDTFGAVFAEQFPDQFEFGASAAGDLALPQIRAEGFASAGHAGGHGDEPAPAVRIGKIDLMAAHEIGVGLARQLIFGLFLFGKLHPDPARDIGGEHLAFQFVDVFAEHDRADQLFHDFLAVVLAFGRGCEAEPVGRDAHRSRHAVDLSRQMVALVEHDQAELVADEFHLQYGGIVGADGEGKDLLGPAAEHADLLVKKLLEHFGPLYHEVDGGSDDEGRAVDRGDAADREIGFARASGHDDRAAGLCRFPAFHGLFLVFHGGESGKEFQVERTVITHPVVDLDPMLLGQPQDGCILIGGGAPGTAGPVVLNRQSFENTGQDSRPGFIPEQEGPRVEFQFQTAHGRGRLFLAAGDSGVAGDRGAAGPGDLDDLEIAHQRQEMFDLLRRAGNGDAEFILVDIGNVAVEEFHQLHDGNAGERGSPHLDDRQFQFQIIGGIEVGHVHHIHQLVQLFFDLLKHFIGPFGHDGHAGEIGVVGVVDRQRLDVVAASAEQPGDSRQRAELVFHQHGNRMLFDLVCHKKLLS